MKQASLFSLVNHIYAAISTPERWQDFLVELSEAFGGAAAVLVLRVRRFPPRRTDFYGVHLRTELEPVYIEHLRRGLPWGRLNHPCVRGRFGCLREAVSDAQLARTDFYEEWMKPQAFAPENPVGHVVVDAEERALAGIGLWRRVGGRPFSEEDLRFGDRLVPHLQRAMCLEGLLAGAEHERLALAEVMNRLPVGVMLVDARRRPVVINRFASRIVEANDGFWLAADGLHAANPRDDLVLRQLLGEAIERAPNGEGPAANVIAISRPSGRHPYPVFVAPLLQGNPGDASKDAVASILIGDPEVGQGITTELLRTIFHLTPAEAELVKLLAEGNCLADAAALRGVSMNTVRSQLKQVFAKTDTSHQGGLVRLVLTGATAFPDQSRVDGAARE